MKRAYCLAVMTVIMAGIFITGCGGPTDEELISVLQENIRALENKNLAAYMATLHEQSPAYNQTQSTMEEIFNKYDFELSYELKELKVTDKTGEEATVKFVQITRKVSGSSPFRDNQIKGEHSLKKSSDGKWKIYGTRIEDTKYLN